MSRNRLKKTDVLSGDKRISCGNISDGVVAGCLDRSSTRIIIFAIFHSLSENKFSIRFNGSFTADV